MKRIIGAVCFGVLGLSAAGSLLAEQTGSTEQTGVTHAVPASESIDIVGKRVSNSSGENLGEVNNVLIDPSSGQVTALVVGIGGVFGFGAYHYKVPWQRVRFAQDRAAVLLNVPRDKVSSQFPAYKAQSNAGQKQQAGERKPSGSGGEPGS